MRMLLLMPWYHLETEMFQAFTQKDVYLMEQRQRLSVHGWIRQNYDKTLIDDIINVIFNFCRVILHSDILTESEKDSFFKLLFDTVQK